ncbi:hypothetical protein Cfor_10543 [Coptotermes formosanus]|uniref:DDE Tnp4 domain-containing protein n=1 Tax=Coptotermes formosanus TaxID=36987 RepID=A0A6L2PEP8_COPFO|nr:hypothetical protein Cfor_10543 [Coptotermes formosanus]
MVAVEFFNYKSKFLTVLMVKVDADYKFIATEERMQSHLYKRLERNELNIPKGGPLPQDENGEHMPFVIVGTYPHRNSSIAKRIFNYRSTRARKMVECAFGILCNKWRVCHRAIDLHPDFADTVVKTSCVLHNYVPARDGIQFEDTLHKCPLKNTESLGTRSTARGTGGCLPWQYGLKYEKVSLAFVFILRSEFISAHLKTNNP